MGNGKKMRQIYVDTKSVDEKLENKIVDKVSLYNGHYDSEKQFLMTFKDGSYIAITMERREPDDEYMLCNDYIPQLSQYHNGPSGYLNEKGEFVLDENINRHVKLGIVEYDELVVNKQMKKLQAEKENREFEYFKSLYEKYKDRISEL